MLDQNFIVNPRTSNEFTVNGMFEDGKWLKVDRDITIGRDIDLIFGNQVHEI